MFETRKPVKYEEFALAEIRARTMKESLSAIGRYDEHRVRAKLLDNYEPENTSVVISAEKVLGVYMLSETIDSLNLKPLYIDGVYEGGGIGSQILEVVKSVLGKQVNRFV